ncbi:hypothetical protein SAMN05444167_0997 [Terriglobus roseus]|uniref:Uncharacterized protein n=1 Tax=Terriglobus roseus TaxID=392734 RepID=A0A1G7HB98_9BACT|nr:hypothetical protein SAMN05444167_0997 [Terriglobus roseus]
MRSAETFRSLEQISNRFMLCQVISQSVRLIHRGGFPIEDSVSEALRGIEAGRIRGISRFPGTSVPSELHTTVLFGLPELL